MVEDDADNRVLLLRAMTRMGLRSTHEQDGLKGFVRAISTPFDVVITDVMMPVMSGPALAAALRAHETSVGRAPVPILAVTACVLPSMRDECLRAGMNEVLEKPLSIARLERALARHVKHAAFVRPEEAATHEPEARVFVDADILDLVPRFLENRRADVGTLRGALSCEDFESIRRTGHRMRGSGGGYGFPAITRMGTTIERAAIERDARRVSQATEELEAYLACVRVFANDP